MGQITAKVDFANPPKPGTRQTSGSIKLDNGMYIGVPANRIHEIVKGAVYTVDYTEKMVNGKTYYDMTNIVRVQQSPPPSYAPPKSNGSNHYTAPHDDLKGREIFVTGVVGRAMQSGKFPIDDIINLAVAASAAYTAAMRPLVPERQTNRVDNDLNDRVDDIPY